VLVSSQIGSEELVTQEFPFQIGGVGGDPVPLCSTQEP
jgi:hypothetical protein